MSLDEVEPDRYGAVSDWDDEDDAVDRPSHNNARASRSRTSHRYQEGPTHDADHDALDEPDGVMRTHRVPGAEPASGEEDDDDDDDEEEDEYQMSLQELVYSASSYYAIAKPVTITMVLSALAVCFINDDAARAQNEEAFSVYYHFSVTDASASKGKILLHSLGNALLWVTFIGGMTFFIVLLYRLRFMKCLIGYMIFCSASLLGLLGSNLFQTAVHVYGIAIDKVSFFLFIANFALVGVLAVFWGQGIPKYVTQGYLVATSVILAWHVSFINDWMAWAFLFMLAIYDLCAVLTPCGPLKALVDAMSEDDAPEMPGLLYEAELPAEAKRPGIPKHANPMTKAHSQDAADRDGALLSQGGIASDQPVVPADRHTPEAAPTATSNIMNTTDGPPALQEGPAVKIPLAIAKVYQLNVVSVPQQSLPIMYPQRYKSGHNVSASPLLQEDGNQDEAAVTLPDNPTPQQLRAIVVVRMPHSGGRLEQVTRAGKKVYLERDRHGQPKRLVWVDRNGKVYAEMKGDDEEGPQRNSIRLGLGDFIFYSVLVSKAAQYSFATFIACILVILAGLGGTLVLLSVYHQALPALPISIFMGVIFYLLTRVLVEPWIEAVLSTPYYV